MKRTPILPKRYVGPHSPTSDEDLAGRLQRSLPWVRSNSRGFAESLIDAAPVGWSDKQREWAKILFRQAREAYWKEKKVTK